MTQPQQQQGPVVTRTILHDKLDGFACSLRKEAERLRESTESGVTREDVLSVARLMGVMARYCDQKRIEFRKEEPARGVGLSDGDPRP